MQSDNHERPVEPTSNSNKETSHMIEIYVHKEGSRDPSLLRVREDATAKDLAEISGLRPEPTEEPFVGRQDDEEPMKPEASLRDLGVGRRHHIHCHRCKHVHVSVTYNGIEEDRQFAPAIRLCSILRWATRQFHLEGQDAADMALFLPGEVEPLEEDIHVGSLASFPNCSVSFVLNVPVLVNG